MDLEGKNQIQKLKKELNYAKLALDKWNSLIKKREKLENEIEKMQVGDERHQGDPLLIQQLSYLKKRLRELDTLLDQLEEHSPERIENLENQLIASILSCQPEQRVEYEKLQYELEQIRLKINSIKLINKDLSNIKQLLKGTLDARQRIKRQGILSYIFGANPNQIISQHLQAIDEQTKFLLSSLKDDNSYQELTIFLIELQRECKQRWGFGKIDNFFGQASESLENFIQKMNEQLAAAESQQNSLLQQKEDWLLRNTSL